MLGAIAGDIIGSPYEWNNTDNRDFEMFSSTRGWVYGKVRSFHPSFTDDTVMTLAVARWLMADKEHEKASLVRIMREMAGHYPERGFSPMFQRWLQSDSTRPFNSYGNGCAVRVSPVGLYAQSLPDAIDMARRQAEISHVHPEGIKGAHAIAQAVWMASHGRTKDDIKFATQQDFGYNLDMDEGELRQLLQGCIKEPIVVNGEETGEYFFRSTGKFNSSCQDTVPAAIRAFLQGDSFEDVVRRAVALGGDSDTIAAMAGSIAAPFYGGVPDDIRNRCEFYLTSDLKSIMESFEQSLSHQEVKVVRKDNGLDGAFEMIRIGESQTAYVVPKDRKDISEALRQKFGKEITILSPRQSRKWIKEHFIKDDRTGTFIERDRLDSRTIFFKDGAFHSPVTYPYKDGASQEARAKVFSDFLKMKEYAREVKTRLQTMSGYSGPGSVHYETAYFPVIYHSRIEVWKGEIFAGSIGIDPLTGLLRVALGGDMGAAEWGEDRCFSVFNSSSLESFKEAISYWCLDEGVGKESKSPFLNIDRANRDISMSKDEALDMSFGQKPSLRPI